MATHDLLAAEQASNPMRKQLFFEIYIKFISQSRGKAHSAGWVRSCEWLVPPSDRARSLSTESGLNIKEDTGVIQGLLFSIQV